jgi:hypothetical protein
MWVTLRSAISASSVRISPIDAGLGARPAPSADAIAAPRLATDAGGLTPSRTSTSIRHGLR